MAENRKDLPGGTTSRYIVFKFRLYPTPEQAELMDKTFHCCRYLWNRMLTDAREFYAATDLQYIPTPAHYKKEAPFLKEVDSQALCTVHQNLRQAYLNFFRNPAAFQYPRFKAKKDRVTSFTVYCRPYRTGPSIYLTGTGIQMPKLGHIRANLHRKPLRWWTLVSAAVSKSRSGKYFCSISFKCTAKEPAPVQPVKVLELNPSPDRLYVDGAGNSPTPPDQTKSREKLARMQRKLSRMEPGSNNYDRQLQKIRLLHEHIANQRKDFLHKESRRIANAWDAVRVKREPLRGENTGFGMLLDFLQYKLERQGKQYIVEN